MGRQPLLAQARVTLFPGWRGNMLKYLTTYLGTGLAFAAIDAVYLTLAGGRLYRPLLDYALADTLNVPAAIAFYLVYIGGILLLAILPNRDAALGRVALT